jgi:hypothetical protein
MLTIPISPGELLDKLTILEIKQARLTDAAKLVHVRRERELLYSRWNAAGMATRELGPLVTELKRINETLWELEDRIRAKEQSHVFDKEFIQLARSVYRTNDRRAALKRAVNILLQSELMEEKSYEPRPSQSRHMRKRR